MPKSKSAEKRAGEWDVQKEGRKGQRKKGKVAGRWGGRSEKGLIYSSRTSTWEEIAGKSEATVCLARGT